MTTVLADTRFGVMVSDSNCTDDDRVWLGRKVYRVRGMLVGVAGSAANWRAALDWLRKGNGERPDMADASLLVLSKDGLFVYAGGDPEPERIRSGREAIGSGAKAAMCSYEALNFTDPKRAVQIVCRHDAGSRGPVRVYRL